MTDVTEILAAAGVSVPEVEKWDEWSDYYSALSKNDKAILVGSDIRQLIVYADAMAIALALEVAKQKAIALVIASDMAKLARETIFSTSPMDYYEDARLVAERTDEEQTP